MKKIRHLCRLVVSLCTGHENKIRDQLRESLDIGITVEEIREVILTSYLFDGYPTALEGFRLLSEIVECDDLTLYPTHTYTSENVTHWRKRGEDLCKIIYGPQYEPLMQRVNDFAPELRDAMIVEGYGKVLSGRHLDTKNRELCVVAILAYKNRCRQLMSHSLGALRLSATESELNEALNAVEVITGKPVNPAVQTTLEKAIHSLYRQNGI